MLVDEVFVFALFDDASLLKDVDEVGVAHGAQTVGNDEAGPADHQLVQRLLYQVLTVSCLIKYLLNTTF